MGTILEVKNLMKTYKVGHRADQVILNNINLTVNSGDFIAIMGPSGSGKSTLLYNISGMDQPTSGEVWLDGIKLTGLSEKKLSDIRLGKLGFVFQQAHLVKCLSAQENIVLAASLLNGGMNRDIQLKAENLMKQVGIDGLAERDVGTLSGGEAQRVGICRALMNNPLILFGDEPTGALNSRMSDGIMDILVNINQSRGTIVLVTHDAKVAAKANTVWFLLDGIIYENIELGVWDKDHTRLIQRRKKLLGVLTKLGM